MDKSEYYAEIGMKAAKRAAQKVIEQAYRENRPIPIWKNGKVEYEVPSIPNKKIQPTQETRG